MTAKRKSENLYQKSCSLREQLNQVSSACGQLGLCWCLHYPSGENISRAVRSMLE